jgi:hypothetical protein
MRDALDREATPEGIEEVERLLKATTAEIVPLRCRRFNWLGRLPLRQGAVPNQKE